LGLSCQFSAAMTESCHVFLISKFLIILKSSQIFSYFHVLNLRLFPIVALCLVLKQFQACFHKGIIITLKKINVYNILYICEKLEITP
jgi:hypothetical protein